MRAFTHRYAFLLAVVGVFATSAKSNEPSGRVIWVANNGIDTVQCGVSKAKACRSISFGLANAVDGDHILVGPGRYGDIDDDLQYTTIGDEAPNFALGCIICVQKDVTITSTDGASVTVLQTGILSPGEIPPQELNIMVLITADGVQFGASGQGFTVYGPAGSESSGEVPGVGIRVQNASSVRVVGNTVLEAFTGISLFSPNGRGLRVAENTVVGATARNANLGQGIAGTSDYTIVVVDNVVSATNGGFSMHGLGRHVIARNTSTGNGIGFSLGPGSYDIHHNIASANSSAGFAVGGANARHSVRRNTAVGNGDGFVIGSVSLHENNMIGNKHCGVRNSSGSGNQADASNNYWGSRSGPGPKPADAGGPGSGCDRDPDRTIVQPFSPTPFPL